MTIDGEPLELCDTRAEAVDLGRFTARARRPSELVIRFRSGEVYKVHGNPVPRPEGVRQARRGDEAGPVGSWCGLNLR